MKIHQIINTHRSSNTYVLEVGSNEVVIIDVGNFDLSCFVEWMTMKNKTLIAVFITHEHSDHCNGLIPLHSIFQMEIFCSALCYKNMGDSKQNFSLYLDQIDTFEVNLPVTIVENNQSISIGNHVFKCIETPGHSPGSICIQVGDYFFSGDTILNGIKSPMNLPHSSKTQYAESLVKIKNYLSEGDVILPGHDTPFLFQSMNEIII